MGFTLDRSGRGSGLSRKRGKTWGTRHRIQIVKPWLENIEKGGGAREVLYGSVKQTQKSRTSTNSLIATGGGTIQNWGAKGDQEGRKPIHWARLSPLMQRGIEGRLSLQ